MGVEWTLAGELVTLAAFFAVAVVRDYLWSALDPASTMRRFQRGALCRYEVATERILTRWQAAGMRFVTIPEPIEASGYVVEPYAETVAEAA